MPGFIQADALHYTIGMLLSIAGILRLAPVAFTCLLQPDLRLNWL